VGGRTSEQVLGEEEMLEEVAQKGEDLHTHPIRPKEHRISGWIHSLE
jgi:hypothetical protein